MAGVVVYMSTVSSNMAIKQQQTKIKNILESKKVPYTEVDISASEDDKKKMRAIAENETALPPQIANGDSYCGNFEAFDEAVECEVLEKFLKL
ncbi:SH3 domain-binding glutamic acid-rich-like protein 3 [Lineus longissimus]|uniref:SH3 domain-binding glutamic acid-rich-like protein 3 n=1 Tax=Lineus longissimus TaxID=88925 RepID=UPI002B4E41CE